MLLLVLGKLFFDDDGPRVVGIVVADLERSDQIPCLCSVVVALLKDNDAFNG